MTDVNIAVREATAELIGKYVVSRPDFLKTYYNVLIQRIVVCIFIIIIDTFIF
jgi:hypothetical protein